MDLEFSKEEMLWREAVRDFAQRELPKLDLTKAEGVPKEVWKKMAGLGYFTLGISEEEGDNRTNNVMIGILIEEIARASIGMAYAIMVTYEVTFTIASFGKQEIRITWLPKLLSGDRLGCIALTEEGAGIDLGQVETYALREGDLYKLNGEKKPVSFGTQSDICVVFAKVDEDNRSRNLSTLLVRLDSEGIAKSEIDTMGLYFAKPCSVILRNVKLPKESLLGGEGSGLHIAKVTGPLSEFHQTLSGLICLGAAQAALERATSYAKMRHAFGHPIGKFGAISGKIAENLTLIEAARWLCYRALSLKDRGRGSTKEAAMCGWWCPKVAYKVIKESILIHGHIGYSDEIPLQMMLRDVIAFEIISGTENFLKFIISKEATGQIPIPDEIV